MAGYQFAANERVVLRAQEVELNGRKAMVGSMAELMLTNLSLVYPQKNVFGKVKGYHVWPLSSIRLVDGVPQVRLDSSEFMEYKLEVSFTDETVLFNFKSLENVKEIRVWVNEIHRMLTGQGAPEEYLAAKGIGAFMESDAVFEDLGKALGAFEGAYEGQMKWVKSKVGLEVAVRCPSCNASLKGKEGSTVACPYCGTNVTIPVN